MFYHAYDKYKEFAFPYDELKPLSCSGLNTWGGYSLTLIDALDTLAIMGNYSEFRWAVDYITANISFGLDRPVSVFETNIRILGGLISGHLLASDPTLNIYPEYKGGLLDLAHDLGRRLLPAFNTPTGIPYGTVNLLRGVPPGETTVTCTAGTSTFALEFGLLSRMTKDFSFERAAKRAVRSLWERKSPIGLLGNHIDVASGNWLYPESGISGGMDSFFEYLLKAAILFEDEEYLLFFNEAYQP